MGTLRNAALGCGAVILGLTMLAVPARAQTISRSQMDVVGSLDTRMDQLKKGDVTLDLGFGTIMVTRLEAQASKLYPVVPYVSFRYSDWFALDENEMRINIIRPESGVGSEGFRAGPDFKVDIGRKKFDSPDLRALPSIGLTPEIGGFASYTLGPARVRLNARTAISDGGHGGSTVELNLRSGVYENGGFGLAAEIETDWVSGHYMRAFYGIAPAQSNARLPVYATGGGFRNIDFSMMAQYHFTPKWSLIGVTQFSHLLGNAANSPLTERRGAENKINLGTFVVYTF